LAVSSYSTDSGQVVIHAMTQCAYECQHQQSWGTRTQPKKSQKLFKMANCVRN